MPIIKCSACGRRLEIGQWPFCPHPFTRPRPISIHPQERAVVWVHPGTGEVKYPGRNDRPLPERYRRAGFERREMSSLRELEQFEQAEKVRSEAAWYDRGTGRGFDPDPPDVAAQLRELEEKLRRDLG